MYEYDNNYLSLKLSSRELEVIAYLHKGFTNQCIAECLCISVSTVKAHLSSIYQKLGAKNRIEVLLMLTGERKMANKNIQAQINSIDFKNITKAEKFM